MAYFNSFMVQLKDREYIDVAQLEIRFNSFMVRLKGGRRIKLRTKDISFNSFMVRLKDYVVFHTDQKIKFQFLHGAIKSA